MDGGNNLGITVHVSHRLGDDINVGHIFAWRTVLVLEQSDQHWLFGVSDFSCIHMGTHFVYGGTDELVVSMSPRTRETGQAIVTSAIIYSDSQNWCNRIWVEIERYLIGVAEKAPPVVGDTAEKIPRPGRNGAALTKHGLFRKKNHTQPTKRKNLTGIPRFGKSPMAIDRGSSTPDAHLLRAPSRYPCEDVVMTSAIKGRNNLKNFYQRNRLGSS